MAGGIDWFRWHHGSVTDPKFQLVARKANARLGDVITVWAFVLEKASADVERGTIGEIDFETMDFLLGAEDGTSVRIFDAMTARGLIVGSRIAAWEKRQPKREREDDNSTERSRAFRERQRHATPCNANDGTETPREEKRREEKKKDIPRVTALDDVGFSAFWAAYPNKAGRKDATRAWQKLSPDEALQASILKALAWQSQGEDWRKEGGRFVPRAATYLNGERWLDEPPKAAAVVDIFAGAR
jgi:hypothetical protein